MVKKAFPLLLAAMLLAATPTLAYAADPPGRPEASGYTVSYSENEEGVGSVISVLSGDSQAAEPNGGFYPVEIRTEEADGEKLIIKTYQVPANTSVSLLTEDFEKNGIRYEMQEILKKPLADELESKTVSKTVTAASDSDKEAKLLQLFEPMLSYDEDGYQGQLQLDAGRIITEVSETEPYRYLVTETRQMSGMDRNDTYYIPKTACKNGVQLQLCNVDWTTMGCGEANGRLTPNRFTATAQYSGYATGSRATEYIATATYTGQVQRAVPGDVLYSIVFERAQRVGRYPLLYSGGDHSGRRSRNRRLVPLEEPGSPAGQKENQDLYAQGDGAGGRRCGRCLRSCAPSFKPTACGFSSG